MTYSVIKPDTLLAFLASVLKDIKSERPKITEKDHVRLLFVTRWFLEFFISVRSQQVEAAQKNKATAAPWGFDLVGEVVERSWIVWILKRMRGAVEDKVRSQFICIKLKFTYLIAESLDRTTSRN